MLAAGVAVLAVGCSDNDSDPLAEFVGTWRVEAGTTAQPLSTSTLTCSQGPNSLPLWDKLVLQAGTVSDLIETAGPSTCQFAFNVQGKVASVPALDPFTGKATLCSVLINQQTDPTGMTMDTIDLILDVAPTSWQVSLATPVKGQAPTATLVGVSNGALTAFDETTKMNTGTDSTCQYQVNLSLTKIGQ